jgi:hydroxypyruvate isomerase
MELIEAEVQHPNVFVHLDSYHMNIEENRCVQSNGKFVTTIH